MAASNNTAPRAKRPYLNRSERRRSLLEGAAQIVESRGWGALNMSALAEHAGTSRQLIYQHFPNLETLLAKTAWHIFNDTMEGTRQSIAAHPGSLLEAVHAAEAVSLDLPPGRGDALWQLIAGTAATSDELERVRRGLRELVIQTWLPSIEKDLRLPPDQARIVAWTMIMGFWGMRQLVRDGEIDRDAGVSAYDRLVDRLRDSD